MEQTSWMMFPFKKTSIDGGYSIVNWVKLHQGFVNIPFWGFRSPLSSVCWRLYRLFFWWCSPETFTKPWLMEGNSLCERISRKNSNQTTRLQVLRWHAAAFLRTGRRDDVRKRYGHNIKQPYGGFHEWGLPPLIIHLKRLFQYKPSNYGNNIYVYIYIIIQWKSAYFKGYFNLMFNGASAPSSKFDDTRRDNPDEKVRP